MSQRLGLEGLAGWLHGSMAIASMLEKCLLRPEEEKCSFPLQRLPALSVPSVRLAVSIACLFVGWLSLVRPAW